uniref:Glycoprotein elicitor putative n=1 Tax=Albugo laibachii Nc14 TaxID=890382 RepID=F0W0V5_9STRA|nr:glycoprotein elicitor precursor putative [Albugo laibachii Nc14]|eukprot:CCA14679.1 glycoprotein elicitor precursor putative [Albugo laibachii Nc14]
MVLLGLHRLRICVISVLIHSVPFLRLSSSLQLDLGLVGFDFELSLFKLNDPKCPVVGHQVLGERDGHFDFNVPSVDAGISIGHHRNLDVSTSSGHVRKLEMLDISVLKTLEVAFNATFVRSYNELIKHPKGQSTVRPWSGSYWATALDSINYRWDGPQSDSMVIKYAKAFGLNPKKLADAVSLKNGIDGQSRRNGARICNSTTECDPEYTGEALCSKREEQTYKEGVCIPTWFGICHAWAAAAIMELEPRCAVKRNNVTFEIQDIKGLISYIYDDSETDIVYAGTRAFTNEVRLDKYGRPELLAVRDVTAGDFLIAMANIVSILKKSVIVDVDPILQVWNQPVATFEITTQYQVDPAGTSKQVYGVEHYPFNEAMVKLVYMEVLLCWVVETDSSTVTTSDDVYEGYQSCRPFYLLIELDKSDVVIGGEYYTYQVNVDFIWVPYSSMSPNTVTRDGFKYSFVKELITASQKCS